MRTFRRDLRYGVRMLLRNPGFTSVAVLSLGLGIGANTTMFTVIDALFLRPLPVEAPAHLVSVYTRDRKNPGFFGQSYLNYRDYRDLNQVFSGLLLYSSMPLSLAGAGEPQQLLAQIVTGNYFEVLGVRPVLGRTFRPEEDRTPGAHPVAVISHGLWMRKFAGDPNVVGLPIHLNGGRYTIIGVAPRGFHGANTLISADLWVPMMMYRQVFPLARQFDSRRALLFMCIGRLKPGVSREQAEAGMKTVAAQLENAWPREDEGRTVSLIPLAEAAINPNQRGGFVRSGALLMSMVGVVLLIACVNVASLLLARARGRRKEIAIRLALGAGSGRILRQLLTESVLLSLVGGAAGLALARWGRALVWSLRPPFLLAEIDLSFGGPVVLFTLALAVLTGLLFGLAPALQTARTDLVVELKERVGQSTGAGGSLALRNLLVIGQVALSVVALIGAGLFVRSLRRAQQIDPGFETQRLLVVSCDVASNGYSEARGRDFQRRLLERARSLPSVQAATLAANPPFNATLARTIFIEGQEATSGTLVLLNNVEPGYFQTVGIPLFEGRDFTALDRPESTGVAIVNQAMAQRFWGGASQALGKRFRFHDQSAWREVVGVARNANYLELGEAPRAALYVPLAQAYAPKVTLYARTAGDPGAVLGAVRREAQALDRNLLLTDVETLPQIIAQSLWGPRTAASLLAGFGLLALALAMVGIYGVVSYSVSQRVREIGIRMALGARPPDVLREVLGRGMCLVGAGVAIGIGCALLTTRLLAGFLFGVSTTDPLTFAAVSLLLAAVACAACYLPARRATKVHPAAALRQE